MILMNVYMVFRIVLGIIASFFILFFLINYAGIYTEMQENTQCMLITKNFIKAAEDVYLSGNGVAYDDFSRLECDIIFDGTVEPALIRTMAGDQAVRTPMVFVPGEKLLIEKESLDYGWWRFDFVEALPEMTIIFNPQEAGEDTLGLINSIVDMFPDTTGKTPKIRFGFCDGGKIIKPCDNGASFCEGFRFFSHVDGLSAPMEECERAGHGQTLVRISRTCSASSGSSTSSGVCIAPPDASGLGYAYLNGSANSYIYKISFSGSHSNNPLDLVALIAGADRRNVYGPVADNLYEYENAMFRQELELMSNVMWHRSSLITQNLPAQPGQYSENERCREMHTSLMAPLDSINTIVSDGEYYRNPAAVAGLLSGLASADSIYQDIVGAGCDYVVE
jgi:hypothetical protein